ncbi:conserved hypothetical protein [Thiomonas arsenitoxydans]|uniref:Integrase catalytic domain-containing protein n=1 Tax=Thiomonas arsenitoxydans (strain DSM 22701 / CIP 110005 / 3As) TaxID=426114 RepID=A0ABP1Z1G8_THIA3|nr:conserved hypothetical protein [Thiomonas arsenitoxydans]CQR35923.1 conserved hypothetical protein [Thiomonas arsenitoxydans]CQR39070.1 conserved hypothetical protein [Thiomonas arsenitoxydans]CQR39171.1 conserved hypothetical protein [Thiomonas arsenitoxydans]CQR43451.1 conserved hypothetical protein [Thiomonas sp. CB3]
MLYVTRVLEQVKVERGLPKVIRTDNGPEFAGRTLQTRAAKNGVELRCWRRPKTEPLMRVVPTQN